MYKQPAEINLFNKFGLLQCCIDKQDYHKTSIFFPINLLQPHYPLCVARRGLLSLTGQIVCISQDLFHKINFQNKLELAFYPPQELAWVKSVFLS